MMQSLLRFFFYCWVVSLPFSCGNQKDAKVAIGDRLAGVKILEKVPPEGQPNFPAGEMLFFLLNINNFNTYRTGSLQAYNVKNLTEPLVTEEIPSFATTLDVVHNKYLVLTFESSDDITPGKMEVWEYAFDTSNKLSLTKKKAFDLKRSPDEVLPDNYKKHPLQAINSILVNQTGSTDPGQLIFSCRRGELLAMDVSSDKVEDWKAPVHVRNYGEDAARPAMVVKDDFLLLFPASPELRTQVPVGSQEYDKEEPLTGQEVGPFFKEGVPESFSKSPESLKEKSSYYQLVVYDLQAAPKFEALNQVYVDETFWLYFDEQDTKAAADKIYLRTNFLRARTKSANQFYLSRRSGKLHTADEHEILQLTVDDLTGFRVHKTANAGKKPEDQEKFDFLGQLTFAEAPVFRIKDLERTTLKGASDEYMLYDFEVLRKKGSTDFTDPPEFAVISYKNSANYYGLLKGKGPTVSTEKDDHPHIKTSIRDSYWGLILWDDNTYVTAQNSYKKEAFLVSGTLEPTAVP